MVAGATQRRWLLTLSENRSAAPWVPDGAALVLWLEVIDHHGLIEPNWQQVALLETHQPLVSVPDDPSTWTIEAAALELPLLSSPPPLDGPDNRFLVQLCGTPDPDLVTEWMTRARGLTLTVPFRRELWAEVVGVTPATAAADWGEVHVSRVGDRWGLEQIFTHPDWVEGQPLLDEVVGPSYRMVCRPLVDNSDGRGPLDGG